MTTSSSMNKNMIAILTDFGSKDPFAGIMKGVIYSINPEAVITDLTHEIGSHNIFEGAFSLYQSYKYFPVGTIFLCVVDPGVGGQRKGIIIQNSGYYFVGPDNGLMSLPLKDDEKIYEISNRDFMLSEISSTFHGRDVFAPTAAYLSKGIKPEKFGSKIDVDNIVRIKMPVIKDMKNHLEGQVIFIDKFGNLVTNIENSLSKKIKSIEIKNTSINKISLSYEDGAPNQTIALKGSTGFIEISVNSGSAENILSVKTGQSIIVRLK